MATDRTTKRAQDPAEVRAEIDKAREQIQSSVVALRYEMATAADWREWVRRRPGLCLGAAFVLGVYFGSRP